MERVRISPLQGAMLLVTTITSTAIILLPGAIAGRDAWLATMGGLTVGLAVALIISYLGQKFPRKTIIEYTEILLGKYIGKVVSALFLTFFGYLAALTLWDFGVFISSSLLVGTPVVAINIIGILVATYTARHGLEVIARVNQIFLPLIIISVVVTAIIVFTMPNTSLFNILPVLENGIKPLLAGTAKVADWLGEAIVLGMVLPFLHPQKHSRSVAMVGVLVSSIILTLVALVVVATFGGNSPTLFFPFYSTVLLIEISRVLRLDVVITTIWIIGTFIKISFLLYILAHGTAQWFKLGKHAFLISPLAVIVLSLSLIIVKSAVEYENISLQISGYILFITLLLPAFLLLTAIITGRAADKKE